MSPFTNTRAHRLGSRQVNKDKPKSESPTPGLAGQSHSALVQAVSRVLRPIISLLIARGMTYPYIAELIKGMYVDVAVNDFAIQNKVPTDSRVSLLTGVHRKEVRRLRTAKTAPERPPESVSLGMQLVAHWLADPEYLNSDGRPKAVPRSKHGGHPSFESLVEHISHGDLRARSVLDELERLGIVECSEDDHIRLRVEGFVPDTGFEEKAYYFGRIVSNHVETAVHNLTPGTNPLLDRAVFYDGLLEEDIDELSSMCKELGVGALKSINNRAMKMKRMAAKSTANKQRFCFGVFFQAAPSDNQTSADTKQPRSPRGDKR